MKNPKDKKKEMNTLRKLYINSREENRQFNFPKNEIITSKYSWWDFIPKSLILQFMRIANLYFLATAIVQSIDIISPLEPYSAIGPLGLVLAVSLSREAIEDYVE